MTHAPFTLLHHIGAGDLPSDNGAVFELRSPTDGALVGRVARGTGFEVDLAVAAARAAFGAWSTTPAPARGEVLFRAALLLQARKEAIAEVMAREMGKRLEEARGDVQEAIDTAFYAGSEGRRLFGHTAPSELSDKMGFTLRRPIGVVGVITAWNFPVAVPSWKILPALVCGNTIVWKSAEEAPASGALFAQTLWDAGLPEACSTWCTASATRWAPRSWRTPTRGCSRSRGARRWAAPSRKLAGGCSSGCRSRWAGRTP